MPLVFCAFALSQARGAPPPVPSEFFIGRHTYLDFGPPADFYEVFSIHAADRGTEIERIAVTPSGIACLQPEVRC
jgi:hypothetical protein